MKRFRIILTLSNLDATVSLVVTKWHYLKAICYGEALNLLVEAAPNLPTLIHWEFQEEK